jgi:magnesium-transporting ATPase (P-type)
MQSIVTLTVNPAVDKPWSSPWEEVSAQLGVSPERGLDRQEAGKRRRQYGPNLLRETRSKPAWAGAAGV